MPSLSRLHRHFIKDNFALLTVDVQEKADRVRGFSKEKGLPFPILLDEDGQVSFDYGIRSHPAAFLIDKRGVILGFAFGYREWDAKEMKDLIKSLLMKK